jgi:cytochrome b561
VTAPRPAAAARYDRAAIALHWAHFALVVAAFGVGLSMVELPISPARLVRFNWHKWAGIGALALACVRIAWRLGHAPPPDVPMPHWQTRAAHALHRVLYALALAVPLAGWAYSSASGFPVVLCGVLPLPDFVPESRALADALKPLHKALAAALGAAVLVHAGAALHHQFVRRDGLLARMWFGRR